MTLNNLAVLYSDKNQSKEALNIYRKLAKTNPAVYSIDCANTVVMGVDLLGLDKQGLQEARRLLEPFRDIPRAKKLLEIVESLE